MDKDLVSVIITTCKGDKSLTRAIESVISQTYNNVEIIIVDDNDPMSEFRKQTEKIVSMYIGDKVHYIKHNRNLNGAVARNTGARAAKGKYLFFLDDDDEYVIDRIQKTIRLLEETKADCAFTDVLVLYRDHFFKKIIVDLRGDYFATTLLNDNVIGTGSNIAIRKDKYMILGGFDECLRRKQDYDFLLNIFSHNVSFCHVDDYAVIKHIEHRDNTPGYEESKKIMEYLFNKYANTMSQYDWETRQKFEDYNHWSLLKTAIHNRDKKATYNEMTVLKGKLNLKDKLDCLTSFFILFYWVKKAYYLLKWNYYEKKNRRRKKTNHN